MVYVCFRLIHGQLRTFVLALRWPRLKSLSFNRVLREAPSVPVSKAFFNGRTNKNPKSIAARTQPCLTLLRMSNGSEELPLNYIVPFMSSWKDSTMVCRLCLQPFIGITLMRPSLLTRSNAHWDNLNESVSPDQVKRLFSEISENEGKGHLLFSALLLESS